MEQMKAAILGACMLGIAVGICTLFKPDKALESQLRFVLKLVLVISLAVPLLQLRLPENAFLPSDTSQQETYSEAFADNLLEEAERQTEAALQEQLAAAGISCTALSVTLHRTEDGRIDCNEVRAACNDPAGAETVLREALGKEVSICVEEALP